MKTILNLLILTLASHTFGLELFVSPSGLDSWSGRLAVPNGELTDGPLATLEAAQKAVSRIMAMSKIKYTFYGTQVLALVPYLLMLFAPNNVLYDYGVRTNGLWAIAALISSISIAIWFFHSKEIIIGKSSKIGFLKFIAYNFISIVILMTLGIAFVFVFVMVVFFGATV